MIESPPEIVEVAVVEVAWKEPKVGVEVATMLPDALVESRELMAVEFKVMPACAVRVLEKVFVPLQVLLVVVPKARDNVRLLERSPPPRIG